MRKNAKKLFALILALCMSLTLLTACGGDTAGSDSGVGESSSGGETITWRLQSSYSLNSLQGDMATNLKEALETATNGRLQVELYEPGALCQTSDILTYLSQNAFDWAVIFGSTFSGLIPEADLACGIPFAWESSAEIYDVMENYGLLDVIQEAYGELNLKYYWNAHGKLPGREPGGLPRQKDPRSGRVGRLPGCVGGLSHQHRRHRGLSGPAAGHH